jgi:hypothetical protein
MGVGEHVGVNVGECTGSEGRRAVAPPSGWYTGTWAHGNTVTLTGSGFGTRADNGGTTDYLCTLWDPCENTALPTLWDGEILPYDVGADYQINYRTPAQVTAIKGSPAPATAHARDTKYICGCHSANDYDSGDNVMVGKQLPNYPGAAWHFYANWFTRVDPDWSALVTEHNYKWFHINDEADYLGPLIYLDTRLDSLTNATLSSAQGNRNTGNCAGWLNNIEGTVNPWSTSNGYIQKPNAMKNPVLGWHKMEINFWMTPTYDTQFGYNTPRIVVTEDGVESMRFYGQTDWANLCSGITTRWAHIGGYSDAAPNTNNFRYFNDIYIDVTRARVVLTDNATYASSTKIAPQPPLTAAAGNGNGWTASAIDVEVNLAEFTQSDDIHCHVFHDDGTSQYLGQATAAD